MPPAVSHHSHGLGKELQHLCVQGFDYLQGSHSPRSKQTSERLKGIEKESSRTSLEVFSKHKYLYSFDVGFTSTHSTPTGRACKYERGFYVHTICSCLPLSLWLSPLCYLLFLVCLNQGERVSGKQGG